ncbi:MAG: rod shape-determining protein [bacterium]|nr:rod shape-determining protein [bacterium]
MNDSHDVIHVGIDLGTSRSAISAADSQRHLIDSFVGWPVDLVARKILKKDVLIGREAVDNRTMLDLRRPLERGLIKEGAERDTQAVRELLQYLLSLVGLDPELQNRPRIRAVVGAPAEALRVNKQQLRAAMQGLADHVMIVSEPFAVAYGQEALLHTMIIDIGAGTTDFCVMNGHYPTDEDQRTLDTAGDLIDMKLSTLIQERYPNAQFTLHMIRSWKEQWGYISKTKARVMITAPVAAKPTELDITDEMRMACEILVPPISETMLELIARVEPEFQESVRENIILAGGSALVTGLREALENDLSEVGGGKVRVVSNPDYAGSDGALAIALDALDTDWDVLTT